MAKREQDVESCVMVAVTRRDSETEADGDDAETALVSSEQVRSARAAIESITSETSTIDCHPIVVDDGDDDGEVTLLRPQLLESHDPGPEREAVADAREELSIAADEETRPMPLPGDISGALETVPLNQALVQQVLAQVDARAAARGNPRSALQATIPSQNRIQAGPARPIEPPRRLGVEIAIALFAFLLVALPALYFLYLHLG